MLALNTTALSSAKPIAVIKLYGEKTIRNRGAWRSIIGGGGGTYSYIRVHRLWKQLILKSKLRFQKELIRQSTNIWTCAPPLNYRSSGAPDKEYIPQQSIGTIKAHTHANISHLAKMVNITKSNVKRASDFSPCATLTQNKTKKLNCMGLFWWRLWLNFQAVILEYFLREICVFSDY